MTRLASFTGFHTLAGSAFNPLADLPAVISITKDYGEPRYPSFTGIRKASKAEFPVWSLADLGIDAPSSSVTWPEVSEPARTEVTTEIIEGDSPAEKAKALVERLVAEKVL